LIAENLGFSNKIASHSGIKLLNQ
jgi:Fe2+ transport system protein B